jgi:hypothetical protein
MQERPGPDSPVTEHLSRKRGGHGFGLGGGDIKGMGVGFEAQGLFGEGGLEREGWSENSDAHHIPLVDTGLIDRVLGVPD